MANTVSVKHDLTRTPRWDHQLPLFSLFSDNMEDTSPEHIAQVCSEMARILRTGLPASFFDPACMEYDPDLAGLLAFADASTVSAIRFAGENNVDVLECYRGLRDQVQRWAETHRVWLS